MTKISTYTLDEKITALDKWIGSDVNMQNRTKNFTPKKLAEYFNENQVINIGVPLQYKYYTLDPLEERPNGTLTFETEIGPTVNFSAVTTFLLSKYTTKQNIVSDFLNFLDGCKVLLFKSSDINSFGFYRISNIEPYEPDPNFFVVTVDYETGNGFMQEDNDYMLSLVSLPGGAIPTKTSELINDGDDGINPFISDVDINRAEWDAAYDGKINSAEVTGTSTKTLTLTKQDGSTIEASWTDDNTDAVTSVFGRIGDVTAQSGDYNTGQITEVTNKKYQTDNQALFNDATSSIQTQLNSKQPSLGYTPVPNTRTITINGTSYDLSANRSWTIDTNSAVWGNISGTLSNQTDLQIALNAKVPYSGATGNINLGEYGLTSGYYKFDLTPTGTPTSLGTMYWDSFYRTVSLIDGDGDTTLQIGQEERVLVHNNTGSTLTDGQVVYVTGSTGELPSVSLASNTSEATSSVTFGVVTETILNGADGFITTSGIIHGLNTLSYNEGSAIWLGSTPGTFTQTKPIAPLNSVLVGYVIKKSGGNGSIFVKIQNGYELEELHDVLINNVSGNEILAYEGSPTNLWKNKSVIDVLGFTPYNSTNPSNYISLTALSSTATGLSYNNTNGVFSLTSGYVIPTTTEESNWNTAYSNRITSASSPLSISSNSISISQATSTTNGYLTSSDWTTFNNKQAAGNYITALTGEATASGPGSASVTLVNSAVTGKVLTGVNITGGSIADTDSILTAFGKVQNQINGLIGGSIYQSVWNASTNTPALTSSVGTKGYYYIVNVAGSTNLNGITDWKVGDWAIYDGTAWQKVDNTDAVSSVNGFTGAVSLTTSNISEGTNLYYTEGRVSANTDVAANTAARHNAVTLGTANGLSLSTQVLSLGLSSTSTNGALSSTDWNTFNNKANNNAVVHLTGNETIDGIKTFIGSSIILDNSSGTTISTFKGASTTVAEFVFNSSFTQFRSVASGGYLFKNSASANSLSITDSGSATFLNSVTATSFIKSGGTSSQFLKADGSVDSSTYASDSLVVKLAGSQTITGSKLFTANTSFQGATIIDYIGGISLKQTGLSLYNQIVAVDGGFNFYENAGTVFSFKIRPEYISFGDSINNAILNASNLTAERTFDLPNASGTIALTSNIPSVSGTTNYIPKFTGANSLGNSLIYDNGTNVGIGTNSPNRKLEISTTANGIPLRLQTDGSNTGIEFLGGSSNYNFFVGKQYNVSNAFEITPSTVAGGTTFSNPALVVNSSGNVGIGTTSPSRLLSLGGAAYVDVVLKSTSASGVAGGGTLYFGNSSTDSSGILNYEHGGNFMNFFTAGSERMRITSSGNVGIGITSPSVKLVVDGGSSDYTPIWAKSALLAGSKYYSSLIAGYALTANQSAQFGYVYDTTTPTNSYAHITPFGSAEGSKFIVRADGNVGIGTTAPAYKLSVLSANSVTWLEDTSGASGAVFALFSAPGNTGIGSIARVGTTSAIAYNSTSDYRLKEDLKEVNGLDKISKIKIYDFKWKNHTDRMDGVMAHELQEVVPYAVTGEKDGEQMQSVDYSKLVPLLIASIQELKAEIEILKNK